MSEVFSIVRAEVARDLFSGVHHAALMKTHGELGTSWQFDADRAKRIRDGHLADATLALFDAITSGDLDAMTKARLEQIKSAEAVAEGTVKVSHPSATSLSWRGHTFERDADGNFSVPASAVAELKSHGVVAAVAPPTAQ
jgi:hypothetical protein